MAHPFFDTENYPWHLPEARAAYESLYSVIYEPKRIHLIYRECASNLRPLALNESPDLIWQEALQQLTAARALEQLCNLVLARPELAAAHDSIRAVVQARSVAPISGPTVAPGQRGAAPVVVPPAAPPILRTGPRSAATSSPESIAIRVMKLGRRLFRQVFKPFTEAPSLESFADRGYWYFGALFVAPALGVLYWLGHFARTVESLPIAQILHGFLAKYPPFDAIPLKLPLVGFIGLFYLVAGLKSASRRWLGRQGTTALLRLCEILLAAGEWCIRHRGWSVVLVLLLVSSMASALTRWTSSQRRSEYVRQRTEAWQDAVERAIEECPLDGNEAPRFAQVAKLWISDARELLSEEAYERAVTLQALIENLHRNRVAKSSWQDHLRGYLASTPAYVAPARVGDERANRLADYTTLLLARLHIRRAGDECTNQEELAKGEELLGRILHEGSVDGLAKSVENAHGNIESCRLYFGISTGDVGHGVKDARIDRVLAYYARAAQNEASCGFADQRRRNNTLDLKLKLALFTDSPLMAWAKIGDRKSWLETPEDQAADLEQEAAGLLKCNSIAPLSPLRWITVSGAFGAAARLRELWSKEEKVDLKAAGIYLALAHSFSPAEMHDWNLRAYCDAVSPEEQKLRTNFVAGLESLPSLPPVDQQALLKGLTTRCK